MYIYTCSYVQKKKIFIYLYIGDKDINPCTERKINELSFNINKNKSILLCFLSGSSS